MSTDACKEQILATTAAAVKVSIRTSRCLCRTKLVTVLIAVIGMSVQTIAFQSISLGITEVIRPEILYQPVVSAVCCFPISRKRLGED
jgi:hypothetical protein